jgi:3-oxoacyl-[acyl-carrier-protein] synthase III
LELNPAQTHAFRRIHELDRMHYDPEFDLYDLVLPPAQKTLAQTDPRSVRYVVYAHAIHGANGTAPDTAQQIKQRLGLDHATAFSLTEQNCAIPLSAIDVAGALLTADGDLDARVLLVTGEKPEPRIAKQITTVMIADGAASCLVSLDGAGAEVRSFATRTRGAYYDGLRGTPEQFRAAAEMRPKVLREIMDEAVDSAGCTLADIQFIIPPNQGRPFWNGTLDGDDLLAKCFFANNARYSHCLAPDVLINYVTIREDGLFEPGRPSMFLATGLGWTFSAMVVVPSSPTGGP